MKKVGIIQARLGSIRLPNKVLMPISGRPMLSYMIERIRHAKSIDQLLVATTEREADRALFDFCKTIGVSCFRGSENDVLDRYYQAAKFTQAEIIVRLTADCPLIDPAVVDRVVGEFLKRYPDVDFSSNVNPATFPDGLDAEVFSFPALERAWKETANPVEREHVTPYFCEEPGRFRTVNVVAGEDYSHYRLTVDYPEDFEVIQEIIQALYKPNQIFHFREIIKFLEKHPEVVQKNRNHTRNPWQALHRAGRKDAK